MLKLLILQMNNDTRSRSSQVSSTIKQSSTVNISSETRKTAELCTLHKTTIEEEQQKEEKENESLRHALIYGAGERCRRHRSGVADTA